MSATNIVVVVDRAKKNVRTLFPPFLILLFVDLHPISSQDVYWSGFVLGGLVVPAQAERRSANTATASASAAAAAAAASATAAAAGRTSGLRRRLRHYSLSPQLPKLIPSPLYQPARPQMVLRPLLASPVVSPVVWCLLSMLRIFTASTIVRCVP